MTATSSTRLASIGVDPGPIPGIVLIREDGTADVAQCSARVLEYVVETLARETGSRRNSEHELVWAVVISVERFVVGRRAARSSSPQAGQQTRDQVGVLQSLADDLGVPLRLRTASEVMTWASDDRLAAAGLLEATKGMRHARAAAKHALYTAVKDCGAPDPLSARSRTPTTSSPR